MKSQTLFPLATAGSGTGLLSASNHLTGAVVSSWAGRGRARQRQREGQRGGLPGAHQNSFSTRKPVSAFSSLLRATYAPNRKSRSVRTLMPAP